MLHLPYTAPKMKIAHLVLAHNLPEQLFRLANKLYHPDADIYVYLDAKADINDYKATVNLKNVYFLKNRINISWCDYSTVKGTLFALEEILKTGIIYSHINFLSGQDYPLKNVNEIHQFLAAGQGKSFMLAHAVQSEWTDGLARTKNFHLGDYDIPGKYRLQSLINSLGIKRKVPGGLTVYGGSQWFMITPKAAGYVIQFLKENKKLVRYFRLTFAPDEIVFPTILMASVFKDEIINNNFRFIEMSPENFRPITLDLSKKEALLNSGMLYARKMDPKLSSTLMSALDETTE